MYVETLVKRWDRLQDEWFVCDNDELKNGNIIRVYERHTQGRGRWFLKQVGGMSEFVLLDDAKPNDVFVGAWLNKIAFDFIRKGVSKNND